MTMPNIEDWPNLTRLLWALFAFVGAPLVARAVVALWRWHKGQPMWRSSDLRELIDGLSFVALLYVAFVFHEADAGTGWLALAILAPVVIGLLALSHALASRRLNELQARSRPNPNSAGKSGIEAPACIVTDAAVQFRAAAGILLVLAAYIGGVFAIAWAGKEAGWSQPLYAAVGLAWLLAVPLLLGLGRYPGRLSQDHALVIAADPQHVWDILHCRATEQFYRASVARIEKLADADNRFAWYVSDASPCSSCGLPRASPASDRHVIAEVIEEVTGRRQRLLTTFPPGTPFLLRLYSFEDDQFEIAPHPRGTKVTYRTSVVGPRLWMLGLLATGNIPRDLLADLKAHMDGTSGTGVFASGRRRKQQAETAPRLCGCS